MKYNLNKPLLINQSIIILLPSGKKKTLPIGIYTYCKNGDNMDIYKEYELHRSHCYTIAKSEFFTLCRSIEINDILK